MRLADGSAWIPAQARQMAVIDIRIGAGRLDEARSMIGRLGAHEGEMPALLRACLEACDDELAGRMDAARRGFEQVAAATLPLPGVQKAAGRFFLARREWTTALQCLARAQLCGADVTPLLLAASRPEGAAPELLKHAVDADRGRDLGKLLLLKQHLLQAYPRTEAAAVYAAMCASWGAPEIVRLPLVALREHALAHAAHFIELAPAARLALPMSQVLGAPARTFEADVRSLFVTALDGVRVAACSSLVQAPGAVLFDHQGDELSTMPPKFGLDRQFFDLHVGEVTLVRFGKPMELDEAIPLLGWGSRAFGHWITDFLLRLFMIKRAGVAGGVPILIDACMPPTHREAVEWFAEGRHPIVEVPVGASVSLRRAWLASTHAYAPFCFEDGVALPIEQVCARTSTHTRFIAELLALQRYPQADEGPKKLFLARGPQRHRRLVNDAQLEALCRSHGFAVVHLETLPFVEQLRLLRGATHVVGPDGSAMLFAYLYGAPGLKVLHMSPPALDEAPTLTSMAAARGVEVLVMLGRCEREEPLLLGNSDYSLEVDAVESVLHGPWIG